MVLLTADREVEIRCSATPQVTALLLQFSSELESLTATWEQVCRLLWIVAIIYGRIDLVIETNRVYIYGVWKDKRLSDWIDKHVQLGISSDLQALREGVERDLRLLARLKEAESVSG